MTVIREPTAQQLMAMKPQQAERAFNQLSLDRMVALVLSTPWRHRTEIIQLAKDAAGLIRALPEEEVYWTIKERGIEDSLSLIAMTSQDQFQFLIDIDCWSKDRLDLKNMLVWYRMLGKCNEAKVAEWFGSADEELLIYSLKKLFKVYKIEEEKDISEEYENMPLHTIDGIYYLHFMDDSNVSHILPLLNVLYQHNQPRFYSLIEGALWDADAEVEDEAFRWRQSRVADKGFPDLDEAQQVDQFLSDKDMRRLAGSLADAACEPSGPSAAHSAVTLRYVFDHELKAAFLSEVIHAAGLCDCIDRFQNEALALANKIVIGDALEIRDISSVRRALRKALGYCNAGLEIMSNNDPGKAQAAIISNHASVLFQIGYTAVLKLQRRFLQQPSRLWRLNRDAFKAFYDTPWAEAVQGIMMMRPLFYEGLAVPNGIEYRDFERWAEIKLAAQALDVVSAAEYVFFDILKIDMDSLLCKHAAVPGAQHAESPRCSSVFLTVLANQVLYASTRPEPLSNSAIEPFLERIFEPLKETDSYIIKPEVRCDCLSWLAALGGRESSERPGLEPFVDACLALLQEELGGLVGKKIDAHYITSLLLKNSD